MQIRIVSANEAGQRLDKLLAKYLKEAPAGFLYKMLRKKNITLNGKKAQGGEKLQVGDEIRFFLSDETFDRFSGGKTDGTLRDLERAKKSGRMPRVVYEDGQVLLLDKPAGMLSQKARPEDLSLNEYLLAYLLERGEVTPRTLGSFRPAVCNRLDRNTSGLVAAGKTLAALQDLSALLRSREMEKYYLTVVKGQTKAAFAIRGYLEKDERTNRVRITEEGRQTAGREQSAARPIETRCRTLATSGRFSLLEVHLITGRTHQIRAHLASVGHPVAGDAKYGDPAVNRYLRERYGLCHQLLHAWRLRFPPCGGALAALSGQEVCAGPPALFRTITEGEGLTWRPGIQED